MGKWVNGYGIWVKYTSLDVRATHKIDRTVELHFRRVKEKFNPSPQFVRGWKNTLAAKTGFYINSTTLMILTYWTVV